MKVLHVLASLDQRDGGPIRAILDLSAATPQNGLDSHIVAPGPPALNDNALAPDRIHATSSEFPHVWHYSGDLRRWLRQNVSRFDGVVIHGMWLYPGLAAASECVRLNVPYACFPHGMLDHYPVNRSGMLKRIKKHLYWHFVERHIFRRATAVFFTTAREMQNARATFRIENRHFIVVPYGVTTDTAVTPMPTSGALWQPSTRRVALFLGRVHPKKNVHFLIEAWNRATIPPDYHLIIAGPGAEAYQLTLRRLASRGPYCDRIHFVGYVGGQDKYYLLSRAQWFLLPSLQENFGVAVLEAVRHGCGVAISNQVYLADLMRPESEILDLHQSTWVKFFNERLGDDAWCRQTADRDHACLGASISVSRVNAAWAATLHEVFATACRSRA